MRKNNVKTVVVHCMDFRFQRLVEQVLTSLHIGIGDFDRVSVAGGAQDREALEKHLPLAQRLHGVSRAILMVHEDCGAGAVKSDLLEAANIARQLGYSDIRCYYLLLDGTWEEVRELEPALAR